MNSGSTQNKALLGAALIALVVILLGGGGGVSLDSLKETFTPANSATDSQSSQDTEGQSTQDTAQKEDEVYKQVQVIRVVDGDTLQVQMDGQKQKVRLIGINTPESVTGDETRDCEEGQTASDYTKSLVKSGQTIWLTRDISYEDDYGRLLRYVWLEQPKDNSDSEYARCMLNAILVKDGYAQAKSYPPDTLYDDLFARLGCEAIQAQKGVSYLWS